MPTTMSYGTWSNRAVRYSLTVEQTVGDALNGEYTDAQVAAVTRAYRDATRFSPSYWWTKLSPSRTPISRERHFPLSRASDSSSS